MSALFFRFLSRTVVNDRRPRRSCPATCSSGWPARSDIDKFVQRCTRRTCGLFSPLVELFFLSNLDEPSVTCFSNDIRYARIVPFVRETILFFPSFFLFLASSLSTRSAHRREKFLLFPRTLAPTIELSRESTRDRESLFSFLVPLFFSGSLSMSLSLSLSFSARACVRIRVRAIFFLFIPFLSPL